MFAIHQEATVPAAGPTAVNPAHQNVSGHIERIQCTYQLQIRTSSTEHDRSRHYSAHPDSSRRTSIQSRLLPIDTCVSVLFSGLFSGLFSDWEYAQRVKDSERVS